MPQLPDNLRVSRLDGDTIGITQAPAEDNGPTYGMRLTPEQAAELIVELATAIGPEATTLLGPARMVLSGYPNPNPPGYSVGTLARSAHHPGDRALRDVTRAIEVARRENVSEHELYGFIANGLTGAINGYRERLLAQALRYAAEPILDLTQEEARDVEARRRTDARAAAILHQRERAIAVEELSAAAEWADVEAGAAFDHDNRGE